MLSLLKHVPSSLVRVNPSSPVPPRTWHLSSVSTEHTNLPRSYPHARVPGYEPPRSYHHMLSTIHEPTCSWHSISWPKYSIIT